LKSFYNQKSASRYIEAASVYWNSIKSQIAEWRWLESGTLLHVPLLLLARIDGKSPVEYVREPVLKDRIRAFARSLIADKPGSVEEVLRRIG
jgi:hypothetical protein